MEMNNYVCSLILCAAALCVCQSSAFLLPNECPAPPPCTCYGYRDIVFRINCDVKGFTAIPQIELFNITVKDFLIYFFANNLTTIPSNAFKNLISINTSSITIDLSNNKINMIDNDAFTGAERLTSLNLNGNNLTTIPFAISKLTHLQQLSFAKNPLRSIDPSVMPNIGGSLKILELDLGGFTEWPTDLHYLRTLESLTVNDISFTHLDINAFRGFENTLKSLTMGYSKLEKVPHAICLLTHLAELSFKDDSNLKVNKSSIFEPCGHTLPTVKTLNIRGNNFHHFPDVFSLFPSLNELNAIFNNFQYIDNAVIPTNANLTYIYLGYNFFERIPSALNKFKSLYRLDITYNKIRTVESADLYGLSNLKVLDLSYNPVAYIDSSAFSHNPILYFLGLDKANMDHIPQAVIGLSSLRTLNLEYNEINCTCEMSYLKPWNVSVLTYFHALCASSTETIQSFVMTSLQSCPDA